MIDAPMPAAVLPARVIRQFFRRPFAACGSMRSPHVALFAGGLILPNLLSPVSLTSLVDIELPPRTGAIMLYATVAICARRLPFTLTVALFLAVLTFGIVHALSLLFGLAPTELLAALDQARRIRFFASPLYISLIGAVAVTTCAPLALATLDRLTI